MNKVYNVVLKLLRVLNILAITFILTSIFLIMCSCGSETQNKRTRSNNTELEVLKQQILKLQGTITQINNFVASDFSNCNNSLPPFEAKICQIAQTATAEQQIIFVGQLQEITKIFQDELYGSDCIDDTSPGCPVNDSITERVATVEVDVSAAVADIAILQADVATLILDLANLNDRLDDFNGSGSSIETIITNIQTDITNLDNRVDNLENTVNNGDVYKTHLLCGDNANSGPAFEPVLITGNNTTVIAYIVSSASNGMGIVSEAGITGNQYLTTRANTRACKFKIYDLTTQIKLCWKNTDRLASSGQIDSACDSSNNFANPTSQCTCVN